VALFEVLVAQVERLPKPRRTAKGMSVPEVEVWWLDATSHTDDAGVRPEPICSVGFPVAYDVEWIRLAGEWHASGGHRDFTTIPRGIIRSMRVSRWIQVPEWVSAWISEENTRVGGKN